MIPKEVFVRQIEKLLMVSKKTNKYYDLLADEVMNDVTTPIDVALCALAYATGARQGTADVDDWVNYFYFDVWDMGDKYPYTEIVKVNGKTYSIGDAGSLYDMIATEYGKRKRYEYNA